MIKYFFKKDLLDSYYILYMFSKFVREIIFNSLFHLWIIVWSGWEHELYIHETTVQTIKNQIIS